MGATIPFGRDFKEELHSHPDGHHYVSLVPIDGGGFSRSYSTVEEVFSRCEMLGVDRALWPEYYDNDDMDIPLAEVEEKCSRLKDALARLSDSDINAIPLLPDLWRVLQEGCIFYITT